MQEILSLLKERFSKVKLDVYEEKEYIFIDKKPLILVSNGKCYVKIHDNVIAILPDAEVGYPYEGARLHYIVDFTDMDTVELVLRELWAVTLMKKKGLFPFKKA